MGGFDMGDLGGLFLLVSFPLSGGGVWLLMKVTNACVKKGGPWRLLGCAASLLFGGIFIFLGYYFAYIGYHANVMELDLPYEATHHLHPGPGWILMIIGGLFGIGGILWALTQTKEDVEKEELTGKY